MRIAFIEWDDANLEHATRHGVSASEIEQAIARADRVTRNRKGRAATHLVRGTSAGGRHIVIAIDYCHDTSTVRPITAWEE